MRRVLTLAIVLAALCACAGGPPSERRAVDGASIARGHALAAHYCGNCHAVERSGESGFPGAPRFRALSHRYSIWSLEEALAEGIVVGHPAMPAVRFEPAEVSDLLAYMQSIQEEP